MLKWELEDLVDEYALLDVRYLYPTLFTSMFSATPSNILKELLAMVDDGKLKLQWQVFCPRCSDVIGVSGIKSESLKCECGKSVEINESTLVPAFSVSTEYKNHVANRDNIALQRKAKG